MVTRPRDINLFEFVTVATLRAKQLLRGCTPRVPGILKITVAAQQEVASGKVVGFFNEPVLVPARSPRIRS